MKMMWKYVAIVIALIVSQKATLSQPPGTHTEAGQKFYEAITSCVPKYNLGQEVINKLQSGSFPMDTHDEKCFAWCIFHTVNLVKDDGTIVMKSLEKFRKEIPELFNKYILMDFVRDRCSGKKLKKGDECETAAEGFKCVMEIMDGARKSELARMEGEKIVEKPAELKEGKSPTGDPSKMADVLQKTAESLDKLEDKLEEEFKEKKTTKVCPLSKKKEKKVEKESEHDSKEATCEKESEQESKQESKEATSESPEIKDEEDDDGYKLEDDEVEKKIETDSEEPTTETTVTTENEDDVESTKDSDDDIDEDEDDSDTFDSDKDSGRDEL